ncbi:peptidyl-prolyl cis-trans isomerase precursor, partial [Cymbomonas tetramitiformis]
DALVTFKKEITVGLMKALPELLGKHLAEPVKLAELIAIIPHLQLELYALKRQDKVFTNLVKLVKQIFFMHSDDRLLESCAKTLGFCSSDDTHDAIKRGSVQVLKESVLSSTRAFAEAAARHPQMEDFDLVYITLSRVFWLHHFAGGSMTECGMRDSVNTMLDNVCDGHQLDEEVVILALKFMYEHHLWALNVMRQDDSPSEAKLLELARWRDTFVHQLHQMLTDAPSDRIKDEVYNIEADFFVVFSREKLQGTRVGNILGFTPSLVVLKAFWEHCEKKLDSVAGKSEATDKVALASLCNATRLVAYNILPEHSWLPAAIVSHFVLHGKTVAEIIKSMCGKLKKHNPGRLWEVYLGAMKTAFERHMVSSVQKQAVCEDTLEQFKDLSIRIAQVYTGQLQSDRPTAAKIVRAGVNYGLMDTPARLSFWVYGLTHFTNKIEAAEVKKLAREVMQKGQEVGAVQSVPMWKSFYLYLEHLKEKLPVGAADDLDVTPLRAPDLPTVEARRLSFASQQSGDLGQPASKRPFTQMDEEASEDDGIMDGTPLEPAYGISKRQRH